LVVLSHPRQGRGPLGGCCVVCHLGMPKVDDANWC
jgi:hypothetical protein